MSVLLLRERRSMQDTDEDQFFEGADRMILGGIENEQCVRPASLLDAVAARKDAAALQDNDEEWGARGIMFADGLIRLEGKQDRPTLPVRMHRLGMSIFAAKFEVLQ